MSSFRLHNRIPKVCALLAATLILPALAYADRDEDRGNNRDKDEHRGDRDRDDRRGDRDRDDHIPVVPEANVGWVLIPFVGAVLLFSWCKFSRAKA